MDKKQQLVNGIADFIEERGYSPSYREMCEMVGITSTASLRSLLVSLRTDGVLEFEPGKPRTVRLL